MSEARIPVESNDFCWKNYLNLAIELANNIEEEAYLRSSISRAYYAAFCFARNYMINVDHRPVPDRSSLGMSVHTYLVLYYKGKVGQKPRKENDTRRSIGKDLDSMRLDRESVDYNDYVDKKIVLKSKVKDVLMRSERVISKIEKGGF